MALVFIILLVAAVASINSKTFRNLDPFVDPLSDEFIQSINKLNSTWRAGRNFHRNTDLNFIKNLMGVHENAKLYKLPTSNTFAQRANNDLPENFDSRVQWPNCSTIWEIRNQGSCGSCWAIGVADVISDRICIHSKDKENVRISPQNLLSCCYMCGYGCNGGYIGSAWRYWIQTGIVSGGAYGTKEGCQPYEIAPCDRPSCEGDGYTPKCEEKCQASYKVPYKEDLHFGTTAYWIDDDEGAIKQEIYRNGPVAATFSVYEDFVLYKSGIYQHVKGKVLGGHAIRIIGWGVDEDTNTPYWLAANSWDTDWGDHGFFKIKRGSNECGIEDNVSSGIPILKSRYYH